MPQPPMSEPRVSGVRPIRMRRLAGMAALVVLAGCGSADSGQGSGPTGPGSSTVGSCSEDSRQVRGATTVTTADLDGDGSPEAVRLTGTGGTCPDMLFARVGEKLVSASVTDDGPAPTSGFAVAVPGRADQLIVTRADHPRGGYQLRVYAAGLDGLVELEADGETLVPFVVTDVQEHPFSIDCTDGGVVLTEAVVHEPVGVVPAWDVRRTSYAVDGTTVTAGATEEVADNVLTKQLGARYPELLAHTAFESCRAG